MPPRILVVEDEALVGRIARDRLHSTLARIPVVVLTASFNPETQRRVISGGAAACLPKTDIGEPFIEKVRRLLGHVRKELSNA